MEKVRIGIVEDELIVAYDISDLLSEMGYECLEPCGSYEQAMAMLTSNLLPDIVLLDVNLGGEKDGIDVARFIRRHLDIPLVFVTANSDTATVARAREVLPDAYLVKPFHKAHLYTAIEVALFAHSKRKDGKQNGKKMRDSVFIKTGDFFCKVKLDDILHLSSNENYVLVHTTDRTYPVRSTLQEFVEELNSPKIIRIHRSYGVNIDKIEKINSTSLIVNGNNLPVSKPNAEILFRMLAIE